MFFIIGEGYYGTNAERLAVVITAERKGMKFYCLDTGIKYICDGVKWWELV